MATAADAQVVTAAAAVHGAVMEPEAVRQYGAIEDAVFGNVR
ncbi:hypothetical protein [Streptomyces sp. M2CJ-2]|nr:hypothetical protein [Streptomyces sp. M2CJ-2]